MKRKGIKIKEVLLGPSEMEKTINRLVSELIEKVGERKNVAIVGIRTRGEYIAKRIVKKIKEIENVDVTSGTVDITLYRDDFFKSLASPKIGPSDFSFDVDDYHIVLVDDVLYSGRTVRAAIDAIMDYGRPKSIMLAALVDRGHRELPIQPDFVGKVVPTTTEEAVAVYLEETDGEDKVVLGVKG